MALCGLALLSGACSHPAVAPAPPREDAPREVVVDIPVTFSSQPHRAVLTLPQARGPIPW